MSAGNRQADEQGAAHAPQEGAHVPRRRDRRHGRVRRGQRPNHTAKARHALPVRRLAAVAGLSEEAASELNAFRETLVQQLVELAVPDEARAPLD